MTIDPFRVRLRVFEEVPSERTPTTAHLIWRICRVHFADCVTALDATPGERCFWSERVPTGLVVSFSKHDIRALPYTDRHFDLGLVDLPHLADLGQSSMLIQRYGTLKQRDLPPLIRAGAAEVWRVSRLGLLVKVTDHCHAQCFQDESGWVASVLGTPYARVYATHAPIGRRTEPQFSADSNGSIYLLYRRGSQYHRLRRRAAVGVVVTPMP